MISWRFFNQSICKYLQIKLNRTNGFENLRCIYENAAQRTAVIACWEQNKDPWSAPFFTPVQDKTKMRTKDLIREETKIYATYIRLQSLWVPIFCKLYVFLKTLPLVRMIVIHAVKMRILNLLGEFEI